MHAVVDVQTERRSLVAAASLEWRVESVSSLSITVMKSYLESQVTLTNKVFKKNIMGMW